MNVQLNPFDPAYRKYGVVVAAALVAALNQVAPVVPEKYKALVDLALLLLTAYGVQQVKNAEPPVRPVEAPKP
jgi:hypothetical protein